MRNKEVSICIFLCVCVCVKIAWQYSDPYSVARLNAQTTPKQDQRLIERERDIERESMDARKERKEFANCGGGIGISRGISRNVEIFSRKSNNNHNNNKNNNKNTNSLVLANQRIPFILLARSLVCLLVSFDRFAK